MAELLGAHQRERQQGLRARVRVRRARVRPGVLAAVQQVEQGLPQQECAERQDCVQVQLGSWVHWVAAE